MLSLLKLVPQPFVTSKLEPTVAEEEPLDISKGSRQLKMAKRRQLEISDLRIDAGDIYLRTRPDARMRMLSYHRPKDNPSFKGGVLEKAPIVAEGAGHMLHLEAPQVVASELMELILATSAEKGCKSHLGMPNATCKARGIGYTSLCIQQILDSFRV